MLKEYHIRFFDNEQHKQGTFCIVSALGQGQAATFCDVIADSLDIQWNSRVDWEFVKNPVEAKVQTV